jgi:hypothetical protein
MQWWIVVAVAGILIATSSAPVKFVPGFIIGLGLLSAGIGQWICRPMVTERKDGVNTTSYPWRSNILGITLTVLGLGLIVIGALGVSGVIRLSN